MIVVVGVGVGIYYLVQERKEEVSTVVTVK